MMSLSTASKPIYVPSLARAKRRKARRTFIRVASAYVIWRQVRLTLALHDVLPSESPWIFLKILLHRLQEIGFHHIRVLYLDKGFASGPIIDYLKSKNNLRSLPVPSEARRVELERYATDKRAIKPTTPLPMVPRPPRAQGDARA